VKVAALDLGSNTFLCLLAELRPQTPGTWQIQSIIQDEVRMVRLGEGLSANAGEKKFLPAALLRAEACLQEFSVIIRRHKPDRILAMATAAAREVTNSAELLALGQKFGLPIEIIPGEKEASITFRGALSGQSSSNQGDLTAVLDIGGGSTELILGTTQNLEWSHSFPFGCVKLTESYLNPQPTSEENRRRLEQFLRTALQPKIAELETQVLKPRKITKLLAVAGTPTELARISLGGPFDANKIEGFHLSLLELRGWRDKMKTKSADQIESELGASKGRADVLLAGVMILIQICELLKLDHVEVSTRGVRHGVALELAERP
jgi:exopolyphosphatase/guanosine-5'-triphosphate,3'-diphosphate pyrophosphatase